MVLQFEKSMQKSVKLLRIVSMDMGMKLYQMVIQKQMRTVHVWNDLVFKNLFNTFMKIESSDKYIFFPKINTYFSSYVFMFNMFWVTILYISTMSIEDHWTKGQICQYEDVYIVKVP